jgi:hypothetical protein
VCVCVCVCVWLHATVEKKDPSMCSVALFGVNGWMCVLITALATVRTYTLRLDFPGPMRVEFAGQCAQRAARVDGLSR